MRELSKRVDTSFQALTNRLDGLLRDGASNPDVRASAFDWDEYNCPTEGIPGLDASPEARVNVIEVKTEPRSPTTSDWDQLDDDLQGHQSRLTRVEMTDDDNAADTGRQVVMNYASPYERR